MAHDMQSRASIERSSCERPVDANETQPAAGTAGGFMGRRRSGGRRRRGGPQRQKEGKLYVEGEIVEVLPNTMFRVVADNGLEVLTTLCGKMRRNYIRVLLGDRVNVEVSPYDPSRGRIVFRHVARHPTSAA